jgi:ribose transport system permease protein
MHEVKPVPGPVTAPPLAAGRSTAADRRAWLLREGWTGLVLVALIIGFAIWSPDFFGKLNWLNTSSTATEVLLLALGETFVIIAGGIDLSVGAVLGLSGMAGAWVMTDLMSGGTGTALTVAAGFAAALGIGLASGLLNGWLIARCHIPAFVVTLGTLGIATGLGDLIYNGQEISAIPAWVGTFGNTNLLGWIPVPVLIAAVLCVVTGLALAKTRYGAYTYAIGDSREAAIRAGLPWQRHLVKIYAMSGLLAGIDGVLVMSRLGAASPTSGVTDNLNAIAAVVIGGASLFGGRGKMIGSIIGTLIISVLLTGLIIVNVPPYWQEVAVGVVLITAVYVDQYTGRRRR